MHRPPVPRLFLPPSSPPELREARGRRVSQRRADATERGERKPLKMVQCEPRAFTARDGPMKGRVVSMPSPRFEWVTSRTLRLKETEGEKAKRLQEEAERKAARRYLKKRDEIMKKKMETAKADPSFRDTGELPPRVILPPLRLSRLRQVARMRKGELFSARPTILGLDEEPPLSKRENPRFTSVRWGGTPPRTEVFRCKEDVANGGGKGGLTANRRLVPHKKRFPPDVLDTPCKIFEASDPVVSEFRKFYERGDLPVVVVHGSKLGMAWKVPLDTLDYPAYLPAFFDGLCERQPPLNLLAEQGTIELLKEGQGRVLPVLPELILPLKRALETKHLETMCRGLRVLQHLVMTDEMVGVALVPYYRQLLPILNVFRRKNKNIGDEMDFSQSKDNCLGGLIDQTLAVLERYGGENAYINIKYIVPTYESFEGE